MGQEEEFLLFPGGGEWDITLEIKKTKKGHFSGFLCRRAPEAWKAEQMS